MIPTFATLDDLIFAMSDIGAHAMYRIGDISDGFKLVVKPALGEQTVQIQMGYLPRYNSEDLGEFDKGVGITFDQAENILNQTLIFADRRMEVGGDRPKIGHNICALPDAVTFTILATVNLGGL